MGKPQVILINPAPSNRGGPAGSISLIHIHLRGKLLGKLGRCGIKTLATGLGLGYSPIVPGTIGSLLGIPFIFIRLSTPVWIIISICLFLLGVVVATYAEKLFLKKDSKQIVIDEIVGCIIFLLLVPHTKWCIIIGFILYRSLDIIKPFPACISQSLPGGWGIMMDDLVASVYTGVAINIVNLLL